MNWYTLGVVGILCLFAGGCWMERRQNQKRLRTRLDDQGPSDYSLENTYPLDLFLRDSNRSEALWEHFLQEQNLRKFRFTLPVHCTQRDPEVLLRFAIEGMLSIDRPDASSLPPLLRTEGWERHPIPDPDENGG